VQSRSAAAAGLLSPNDTAPGCGPGGGEDFGLESYGWDGSGGSTIIGYTVYEYPKGDLGDSSLVYTNSVSALPPIGPGGYSSPSYYPNTPKPKPPAHPGCLEAALAGATGMASSASGAIAAARSGQFGQAAANFIRLFGALATTAPFAFLDGLFALIAAPEMVVLLAAIGLAVGVWIVWKSCFSGG
jgi:hypothetical protein